jgi:ribonuclease HIII
MMRRANTKFKSTNRLLAWGHARAIENLMEKRAFMKPLPERAISDQFAYDKETVAKALMSLGREIELVQRHKAESDIAVAAASILARDEFVQRLRRIGQEYGVTFPKGASKEVDALAKAFVEKHGPVEMEKVAKMHFRTALRHLKPHRRPGAGLLIGSNEGPEPRESPREHRQVPCA